MLVNYLEQSLKELNRACTKTYQELVGYFAYLTQYTQPNLARAYVIYALHLTNPS
jgi:hypothetical protein